MAAQRDIASNRRARKWTRKELLGRAAWEVLRAPLFAWTPRPMWAWRRTVLRMFGAQIGSEVHVHPSVRIAVPWTIAIGDHSAVGDGAILYSLGPIRIGARVTISQGAHVCAGSHDWRVPDMPLLKPAIDVGDDVWLCADCFIGPGVTVGATAIVGARAVAMRDIEAGTIVAGNPARVVSHRTMAQGPIAQSET